MRDCRHVSVAREIAQRPGAAAKIRRCRPPVHESFAPVTLFGWAFQDLLCETSARIGDVIARRILRS
jgi:hypothetical protein